MKIMKILALLALFCVAAAFAQAPDYTKPNYSNSPIIPKFVDSLPGLGPGNANNYGQYIPIATPIANPLFPADDYYEIGVGQYTQAMATALPSVTLRGYRDLSPAADGQFHYLGPLIIAHRDKAVRVKFQNLIPANSLYPLPLDTTVMGAGMGPDGVNMYSPNRVELHLHGGLNPWVSDGTPHQWITPPGETTVWPKGEGFQNVPDMAAGATPTDGVATYYYTNQQSGRLLFYHDHSYGITRLNVYAGEVAPYLIIDPAEDNLINTGVLPNNGGGVYNYGIPLVIQDKAFVSPTTAATDPLWDFANWGGVGNLWFPHVYQPNQIPGTGAANPVGRWDYGPWVWPPAVVTNPTLPVVSICPEAFMDTMLVNGTAYPYLTVQPTAYRFRILNGSNDRMVNLQLYIADATGKEVTMVPANGLGYLVGTQTVYVPFDGRNGGVPDPRTAGPSIIQIGTDSGFLQNPVVLPNAPIDYNYDRKSITFGGVRNFPLPPNYPNLGYNLFLAPAERADVIIDFSSVPPGSSVILYNDAPAPSPGFDPRLDYYTGDPNLTAIGGAPSTAAGFGPNTRTIMQFRVAGAPTAAYNLAALQAALPTAFAASQPAPIVPAGVYGDNRLNTGSVFNGFPVFLKTIAEDFDLTYGRMNALLGTEQSSLNSQGQQTFGFPYASAPTEILSDGQVQVWSIVHNGVDMHSIHFHLFDVQIINRVDWVGMILPPDPNEMGWKESIRVNPLENVIVAFRPHAPALPWPLPDSIRPWDVTMPATSLDPAAPAGTNPMTNYAWEYVWHCHILGHEENDMMRPVVFQVPSTPPAAPTALTAAAASATLVNLAWVDNAVNESGFSLQRATDPAFTLNLVSVNTLQNIVAYADATVAQSTTYYFRVQSFNSAGVSAWSNTATVTTPMAPPAAPSALSATAVLPTQINLGWTNNATNQAGFTLQRATDAAFTLNLAQFMVGSATVIYNDTSVSGGTTYYYRVQATNAGGVSAWSNTASATTATAAPAAPSALAATAYSTTQVNLAWTDNSNNETGFTLQRATDAAFTQNLFSFTAGVNATSFSDTPVTPSTAYFYRVQAFNAGASSAWSNTAAVTTPSTLPAAPSALAAVPVSASLVNLAWTDNASNETGFTLQRATDAAFTQNLAIFAAAANAVAYADGSVAALTTYYYRVQAVNGTGVSAWSNTATASTPAGLPAAPSGLTAVAASSTQVNVAWLDNSNNETGFTCQRAADAAFTVGLVSWNTGANVAAYTDTGVVASTTYYYRARAFNTAGTSAWSNAASVVTPTAGIPAAPSNLSAAPGAGTQVNLSWTDNSVNENGFRIQRATDAAFTLNITTFTVGANVTAFADTSAAAGSTYYYRVLAYNGFGFSAWSNTASITTPAGAPATPSGLRVSGSTRASISLTWLDNSNNETGFYLQRAASYGGPYATVATLPANTTAYTNSGLTPNTLYFYRVQAYNATGTSASSNIAFGRTLP